MVSCKTLIAYAVVFGAANVQSFSGNARQMTLTSDRSKSTLLQAEPKPNDIKTSKGGAGSWRAKAKEFLKKENVDASDMKLNIAFVTGNAMKQKEINLILSKHGATGDGSGDSYVNLRILDVDLPEIQGESYMNVLLSSDTKLSKIVTIFIYQLLYCRNKYRYVHLSQCRSKCY